VIIINVVKDTRESNHEPVSQLRFFPVKNELLRQQKIFCQQCMQSAWQAAMMWRSRPRPNRTAKDPQKQ
jgi:hypothetical protein